MISKIAIEIQEFKTKFQKKYQWSTFKILFNIKLFMFFYMTVSAGFLKSLFFKIILARESKM